MRIKIRKAKVSRQAAIKIVMNTNGISKEMAENYTDSELRETLRLLNISPSF